MRRRACAAALALVVCAGASAQTLNRTSGPWELQNSNTTANLRGIHAVGGGVAWASGTNGTVLRTEDAGYLWQPCAVPPGAEKLDFRGIWAWDADTAIVMSSGPGDQSRLYKTTDGCAHWTLLFTNPDRSGFWDAVQFYDNPRDGFVLGDPIDGHFVLLEWGTQERHWSLDQGLTKLRPLPGETEFAASNSCLQTDPINGSFFGTGGRSGAWFIYQTVTEMGDESWHRVRVPVGRQSASSGVFSVDFRYEQTDDPDSPTRNHGVAVGGDYTRPNGPTGTAAWTSDGGRHWTAAAKPPHGYRSAVAWDDAAKAWIAAGTNGSDISRDDGKTWQPLDGSNWNALSLPYIVGPQGRVGRLQPGSLPK